MFLEYHGTRFTDKVIIMPLEITVRFFGGLKQGAGSRAGPNQYYAGEWKIGRIEE